MGLKTAFLGILIMRQVFTPSLLQSVIKKSLLRRPNHAVRD
nr:MAG TPA: hypothetical protein [Caudoviricetes sp.]